MVAADQRRWRWSRWCSLSPSSFSSLSLSYSHSELLYSTYVVACCVWCVCVTMSHLPTDSERARQAVRRRQEGMREGAIVRRPTSRGSQTNSASAAQLVSAAEAGVLHSERATSALAHDTRDSQLPAPCTGDKKRASLAKSPPPSSSSLPASSLSLFVCIHFMGHSLQTQDAPPAKGDQRQKATRSRGGGGGGGLLGAWSLGELASVEAHSLFVTTRHSLSRSARAPTLF